MKNRPGREAAGGFCNISAATRQAGVGHVKRMNEAEGFLVALQMPCLWHTLTEVVCGWHSGDYTSRQTWQ